LDNKSVVIDILGIFGGSTLIVPKEWNVVVEVFSLFGGF
jgi:predicted membrane protein